MVVMIVMLTLMFLGFWHFTQQMPSEYILIKGHIESYQGKSDFYHQPRFIDRMNFYSKYCAKGVVFRKEDGSRVAFPKIVYKNGLWRQIGVYAPTALAGTFCLMRQHSKVYLFAYTDGDAQFASLSDVYTPKFGVQIQKAMTFLVGLVLFYIFITAIGSMFFISDPSEFIGNSMFVSMPIVYLYYLYFHLASDYPNQIYAKQMALMKEAGMSEPII